MNIEYSQGIANDGPVILRDGLPMTPEMIVETLNEQAEKIEKMTKDKDALQKTHDRRIQFI